MGLRIIIILYFVNLNESKEIDLYFPCKEKETEEARYQKYRNFKVKVLLLNRTPKIFITKSTDGAISNL